MNLYSLLFLIFSLSLPLNIKAEDDVIKSKDYKNEETGSLITDKEEKSDSIETIRQLDDMKRQVEKIKNNQKKASEYMEELEKE